MNKVEERQTIETLINEEALLLAKFLRSEKEEWMPSNLKNTIRKEPRTKAWLPKWINYGFKEV